MTGSQPPFWQPFGALDHSELSSTDVQWLTDPSSLTAQLHHTFADQIEFRLKRAQLAEIYPDERQWLGLCPGELHWVREIQWCYHAQVLICARVVIPAGSTHPVLQEFYQLGASSIGRVLFKSNVFKRSCMAFAQITREHPYCDLVSLEVNEFPVWARCSLFEGPSQSVLVSELFLKKFFSLVSSYA